MTTNVLTRLICLLLLATAVACSPSSYSLETALQVDAQSSAVRKPGLRYRDHDPVAIKGRQPRDFAIHGIDISRYNKRIDWRKAKASGVAFAFIKATEGKDDADPDFRRHWLEAKQAGIPRSAYHFYYFCAPPLAQAANYIRRVPKSDSALPPILDVEWNPKSPTCKQRPAPSQVRLVLKTFLDRIERHYGQKPIIYTTVDFHEDNLAGGQLQGYQYWLRSVTAEPKYKYGSRPWVFWQYTGTGAIPGIDGHVDINVYNGSRANWRLWLQRNTR